MELYKLTTVLAAGLFCCAASPAATSTPKSKSSHSPAAASKTTPAKAAKPKTATSKTGATKKVAATRRRRSSAGASKASARPVAARSHWQPAQMQPTPERYKEIQEALAKKGYLHGEPNGKWDQDSVDALRHFQQDQSLQTSGKLDSLSIIALGLGPQH